MSNAGNLPIDLGKIDIDPKEMMFSMYLPISVPGSADYTLIPNLNVFIPLIETTRNDCRQIFTDSYVYLTAKTLWVEGDYIGNRPGWHIDGYGTDDLNYIWADHAPTEFLEVHPVINLSDDCDKSLGQMEALAKCSNENAFHTYPDKHLLRLDNTVIHRSPIGFKSGMRTFVKISISPERYNLEGNAVNHLLPETHWALVPRQIVRNHPFYKNSDFIK